MLPSFMLPNGKNLPNSIFSIGNHGCNHFGISTEELDYEYVQTPK
jgi:hypothetical protein